MYDAPDPKCVENLVADFHNKGQALGRQSSTVRARPTQNTSKTVLDNISLAFGTIRVIDVIHWVCLWYRL